MQSFLQWRVQGNLLLCVCCSWKVGIGSFSGVSATVPLAWVVAWNRVKFHEHPDFWYFIFYLVCSHQETALRGWGLSRVCSRHGGVGRLLACDSHLPSSAPLPCSPSRSLCSGTPSAGSHSLLKGQGTLLREMGNLLKGLGNLSRGSGSPLEGPGSLWCSLCAPQIQVLCPAYSLQKEEWLHLPLKNSRFCTCESNFCLNRRGKGRRRGRLRILWTPRTPRACRDHFDQVRWVWTGAEMEVKP